MGGQRQVGGGGGGRAGAEEAQVRAQDLHQRPRNPHEGSDAQPCPGLSYLTIRPVVWGHLMWLVGCMRMSIRDTS